MEILKALLLAVVAATILVVEGQIDSPCTASMINNFTPCFNVITGSSNNNNNSNSEKQSCCSTLRSVSVSASGIMSMDCACLLLTANVPVPLPINAALSLILQTSCNITGLSSAQCKASGSPLPSPGPISLGPTAPSLLSPQDNNNLLHVVHDNLSSSQLPQLTQAPAPAPTHHRIRPVLEPSASARPSCFRPPYLLLIIFFILIPITM